jgi:hypothetical protein
MYTPHTSPMSLEGEDLLARLGIPYLHCMIVATGDDAYAIGTVGHTIHG